MKRTRAALAAGLGCMVLMSLGAQSVAARPAEPPRGATVAEAVPGVDAVAAALEKRGFEVARGDLSLWAIEDCPASFDLMQTCYFNNPTAPYSFAMLPPWPEEYVDPATEAAFGMDPTVPGPTPAGSGGIYRLDPNEAILVFGQLPPSAAYFGMQSYTFSHEGRYRTDNGTYEFLSGLGAEDLFFHDIPLNTERIGAFNSISNSTNNVVIERQSGSSWGQTRYFVISPDRYMDKQVRQVLHRLSVDRKDVFSEAIPSNLDLGLGPDADDFTTFIRYSRPDDGGGTGTASWQWRQDPTLSVLRVRDARPNRPQQPYPAWGPTSPEPRGGVSEAYLAGDLTDLANRVSQAWHQPCPGGDCVASGRAVPFVDTQSEPMNVLGPKCALIGMDCLGDTQDTSYQFLPGQTYDSGKVYAVAGVLGSATGNSTYVSLGVNNTRLRLGALNVDGAQLAGSAAAYGVANADKFFVHYFTRSCEALEGVEGLGDLVRGHCTSVDGSELLPPGDPASFVERDYIAVGTQRGPESTLLLPSVAMTLAVPAK